MLYTDNWILQDTFLGVYLTLGGCFGVFLLGRVFVGLDGG